jgi:hypothetical protein
MVYPGYYEEDNPIILPFACVLDATGSAGNTFIVAKNPNSDLIITSPWSKIVGFGLHDAYGSGSHGVYYDATNAPAGSFTVVYECMIRNCDIGVEVNGNPYSSIVLNYTLIHPTLQSLSYGVIARNGGQVISLNTRVAGTGPPYNLVVDKAIYATDPYTKISLTTTSLYYCTTGMYIDNNSELEITLMTCHGHNYGLVIGPNGLNTIIRAAFMNITRCITYDFDIQSQDSAIEISSGYMLESKIRNPNHVKINARYHTEFNSKRYHSMTGDVHLGSIVEPTKITMGQGKYNEIDITVLTNDNLEESNAWTDWTIHSNSSNNSTFNIFNTNNIGSCLYIGSSYPIYGIKISVVDSCRDHSDIDTIIWEYWNGTEWIQFKVMTTLSSSPYTQITQHFVYSAVKKQIRFGLTSQTPFAIKNLNGFNKNWIRARLNQIITETPTAEYLRLHTSNFTINKDGFAEYFGDSRPIRTLPYNVTQITTNSAGSRDLYLNKKLSVHLKNNTFCSNKLTRISFSADMPSDIDLSFPIKIKFSIIGDHTTPGNVEFTINWGYSQNNSKIYNDDNSAPYNGMNSKTVIMPMSKSFTQISGFIKIDMDDSNMLNDIIWISMERNAGQINDNYQGNISIIQINMERVCWCNGGHIFGY